MSIASRLYAGAEDYPRMRALLAEIESIEGPLVYCHVGDLDWWRATDTDPRPATERLRLWFDHHGTLLGFVWPSEHQVDLLVHPQQRALEPAMLDWAEHLERDPSGAAGPHQLTVWSFAHDALRNELLLGRGYTRTAIYLSLYVRDLAAAAPEPALPDGFTLRTLADADVHARVAAHHDTFALSELTVAGYRSARHDASYRADLDLVVAAPDGSIAAFCTVWLDSVNRAGELDPVGCRPAYRRQGLARAVVLEGLRRLQCLDARTATAFCGGLPEDQPARRMYAALGFVEQAREYAWRKIIDQG